MGAFAFEAGTKIKVNQTQFRLLRKLDSSTWQAEEARTLRVEQFAATDLQSLFAKGELAFVDDAEQTLPRAHPATIDYSSPAWDGAKVRRKYVLAVLEHPSTPAVVDPFIDETWEKLRRPKIRPGTSSVLRWKARFVRSGQNLAALLDQHDKKGNRKDRYEQDVLNIVDKAIKKRYLCRERGTVQDVLDEVRHLVNAENNQRIRDDHLAEPGIRLIERLISEIPAFDRYAARHGREAAVRHFRSVKGHIICDKPLERAEMDHTQLDMMVIDERTGLLLGRPYLTVCIDSFTRCVLGLHISFEPPSYLTVARCLKDALTPKVDLKTKYPGLVNDWEAHGTMTTLVVDNGREFHSEALEVACGTLGIRLETTPRARPWFKPRVERFFGTLNRGFSHKARGTTFSSILEKQDYDSAARAAVSFGDLQWRLRQWVCDYYHHRPHRSLDCSPAQMWRASIVADDIKLPQHINDLDAILGKPQTCTLSQKGIVVNRLLYGCPELTSMLREYGPGTKLDVRVDGTNLGSVAVFRKDGSAMIRVPAINQKYAAGLSEWQHKVIRRYAADQLGKYDDAGWLAAKSEITDKINAEFGRRGIRSRMKMARFAGDAALDGKTAGSSAPSASEPTPPPGRTPASELSEQEGTEADADEAMTDAETPRSPIAPIIIDDDDDIEPHA